MRHKVALAAAFSVCLAVLPAVAPAGAERGQAEPNFTPGAPGVGDPYFPLDGNGGYDVKHYDINLRYRPSTDTLNAVTTIKARATQDLSAFNLDFEGLRIQSIQVNGENARWRRDGGELTITPKSGLRKHRRFVTVVKYSGVPEGVEGAGFIHTDDGAIVIGQPHVADTWFPVNDHPTDKASYTFHIKAPWRLQAISNGKLVDKHTAVGWTTWTWDAKEPMASYLAMMAIGRFNVSEYRANGIKYWDAIDPDLFTPVAAPRTGDQFAASQQASLTYKRLMRTISVPAGGADLSFWVDRNTELDWDYMFVEAHTPGQDDWTTLEDLNGHTSQDTGNVCPFWLDLHPFLEHYQAAAGNTCTPSGTTGDWWAATGASADGEPEQWNLDLSDYAGGDVELSITYASDDTVQGAGVYVDDVTVSTGEGNTSFEDDGDTFDGWTVPGAPAGSEPNENDWIAGTADDVPAPEGPIARGSLDRQPEIIEFLEDLYGRYPFGQAGGIVPDSDAIGFALETQTRPIYSKLFFDTPENGDSVVVHELAHQWVGDNLAVESWANIWINEGFAQYSEWLWSEHEGLGTAQEIFDNFYNGIPANNPFWSVVIGDPGPDLLFDISIYYRGAMTLQQLRLAVGDHDFFRILRTWTRRHAGGNVTIDQFIDHAEQISGEDLGDLFETWLFTDTKPELPAGQSTSTAASTSEAPSLARVLRR